MGIVLQEEQIERILSEAEDVLAKYVTGDGKVVFNSPAHIVAGVAVTGRGDR
jgi:superfamily II DNA helicase RecQ